MKRISSFLRHQDGSGWNWPVVFLMLFLAVYTVLTIIIMTLDIKAQLEGKPPLIVSPYSYREQLNPDTP